jgi:ATP synthase protein I
MIRHMNHEQRSEVKRFQGRLCSRAMWSALIIAIVFICIHENALAKGLLLGTLFSITNFALLGKTIPMTLRPSRFRAGLIGFASISVRLSLLSIPMVVAIKSSSFDFVAVVIGIFSVQIVTLVEYIIIRPVMKGE